MRLALINERIDSLHDQRVKTLKNIAPFVRKIAARFVNGDKEYADLKSARYTPSDEDDLYQVGLMALWNYLSKVERKEDGRLDVSFSRVKQEIFSAMARGGNAEYQVFGDIPFQISSDVYKRDKDYTGVDPTYDVSDFAQPEGNRRHMLASRAVDNANIPERAKMVFRKLLSGMQQAEVARELNVSKVAVHKTVKKYMPQVQAALEEAKIANAIL